jgi:ribosomal-protein-alanine N-acetyltransferase
MHSDVQSTAPMTLEIREMKAEDLNEIMAIEKRSFPTPWSLNMFKKELRVGIARNLVALAGRQDKKQIVGYINFWIFSGESHLNNIAVKNEFRGKGIASRLMKAMIERSCEEGVLRGTLEVREKNRAAIALYVRYGYVVKGRRPNYYYDSKEDAVIMWREFSESVKRVQKR